MILHHSKSDSVQNQNRNSKESKENIEIDNTDIINNLKIIDREIEPERTDYDLIFQSKTIDDYEYMEEMLYLLKDYNLLSESEIESLSKAQAKIDVFPEGRNIAIYLKFNLYKSIYDPVRMRLVK